MQTTLIRTLAPLLALALHCAMATAQERASRSLDHAEPVSGPAPTPAAARAPAPVPVAAGVIEIDCAHRRPPRHLAHRGAFAIDVPWPSRLEQRASPDSRHVSWITRDRRITVDFGFASTAREAAIPCAQAEGERITARVTARITTPLQGQRYEAVFRSPLQPAYVAIVSVAANHLSPAEAADIIGNFVWTGDIAQLRVLSIDTQRKRVLLQDETGAPFEARLGDDVTHHWGTLTAVAPEGIEVKEFHYDQASGDFHAEVKRVPLWVRGR